MQAENLPLVPEPPASPRLTRTPPTVVAESASPEPQQGAATDSSHRPLDRWLTGDDMPSWLTSMAVHALAVLLLSLWMFAKPDDAPERWLTGTFEVDGLDTLNLDEGDLYAAGGELTMPRDAASPLARDTLATSDTLIDPHELQLPGGNNAEASDYAAREALGQLLAVRGGGMDGRSPGNRRGLARAGGGTEGSEAAVELGLEWLAAHQFPDGGWRFDLTTCPQCQGACRNSGFLQSTTASTGLALLCFMGAGYTHHEGPYQETVANGLYYLVDKMLLTSMGGDLRDRSVVSQQQGAIQLVLKSGNMYSHGIATLALCEAYAMTRDENLAKPAQEAVNFIVYAQHEKGGWRYEPGEPGDLSVTGWQIAALKSALLARLQVPREAWYRAGEFLDSVQDDRGATYGYQEPSKSRRSMSAVGLFCRMMLGWPRDHAPMLKGMARIDNRTPRQGNMYFNYYAAQALHHFGGAGWERWNPRMRDYLVESQSREGHEIGSWYFDESWSDRGGRLYTTTLAILTLEVYYRYMPMYQQSFVDDAP